MTIILFELQNHYLSCQFNFTLLSISIGEAERSLFCVWRDETRWQIDFMFIHFPLWY